MHDKQVQVEERGPLWPCLHVSRISSSRIFVNPQCQTPRVGDSKITPSFWEWLWFGVYHKQSWKIKWRYAPVWTRHFLRQNHHFGGFPKFEPHPKGAKHGKTQPNFRDFSDTANPKPTWWAQWLQGFPGVSPEVPLSAHAECHVILTHGRLEAKTHIRSLGVDTTVLGRYLVLYRGMALVKINRWKHNRIDAIKNLESRTMKTRMWYRNQSEELRYRNQNVINIHRDVATFPILSGGNGN